MEHRLGLAGRRDNVPWLPDSELSIVLEPTPIEAALQRSISARWAGARPLLGRFAVPPDFLEAAAKTGRLLVRRGAIAREIEVDGSGRVRGVVWIDQQSRTEQRASAPLVFLCASALESTRLLLLSRSPRSPAGLGATSGALGRYLMDHIRLVAMERDDRCRRAPLRAGSLPLPSPLRCSRFADARAKPGFGVQVSEIFADAGASDFSAASYGEMLPRPENSVTLDPKLRDAWGIPVLRIECRYSPTELLLAREQSTALRELADAVGVTLTEIAEGPDPPGIANHECGTARMGDDPASRCLIPTTSAGTLVDYM